MALVLSMLLMSLASMVGFDVHGDDTTIVGERLVEVDGDRMNALPTPQATGNLESGGYHLSTGLWWQGTVSHIPSIGDADGDGLNDSGDPAPWNRNIDHYDRNCAGDCIANDLLNIVEEPDVVQFEQMRETTLGDMDRDGDLDLVFLKNCELHILLQSMGNSAATTTPVTSGLCSGYSLELADLDGDGDLDMVVGTIYTAFVIEMNGTSFVSKTQLFPSTYGSDGSSYYYDHIAIGDADGDGLPDLLVAARGSYSSSASPNPFPSARLLMNEADGSGLSFNNTWNYSSSRNYGALDVAFADYDADGDDDVIVSGTNGSHFECSSGSSICGVMLIFDTDPSHSPNQRSDIALDAYFQSFAFADMNENGRLDIIGSHSSGRVYVQYSSGSTYGYYSNTSWYKIHEFDGEYGKRTRIADVNVDGLFDIVLEQWDDDHNTNILLHDGIGDQFPYTWTLAWSAGVGESTSVAIGDIDGNGFPDLLLTPSDNPLSIYRNGGGVIQSTVTQTLSSDPSSNDNPRGNGKLVDLNGDGALDILIGGSHKISYYENDGEGEFNDTPDDVWSSSYTRALDAGDFDKDGYPDLVYSESTSGIRIKWGNESGYNSSADITISPSGETQKWGTIIVADVDEDGFLDILFDGAYDGGEKAYVYTYDNSTRSFEQMWSSLAYNDSISGYPHQTVLADANDDGIHDIVRCMNNRVYVYWGAWSFSGGDIITNFSVNNPFWVTLDGINCGVGDFNEDGYNDILLQDGYYIRLILGPSHNTYNSYYKYGTTGMDLADVDFDGKDELILSTTYSKKSSIFDFKIVGTSEYFMKIWEGGGYRDSDHHLVGDLDSDGIPDLVQLNWYQNTDIIFGLSDIDMDGVEDSADDFPYDPTQGTDSDGDGYGDYASGYRPDECQYYWGDSTEDRRGCPDQDGDGWSDLNDAFWRDSTQWSDADGDGFGDNYPSNTPGYSNRPAHWPGEMVDSARNPDQSPLDFDDDGYEDADLFSAGALAPYDDCQWTFGSSYIDQYGCMDSDYDGMSNDGDFLPMDPTQMNDTDLDGFGDNTNGTMGDSCPQQHGTSIIDRYGCIDADNDGWSALNDLDDNDPLEQEDRDNDTIGDNADQCPYSWSNLTTGPNRGCPDSDGDGHADMVDAFDSDPTQWLDADLDGRGDNPLGTNADAFPNDPSQWADSDGDSYGDNPSGAKADAFPNDPTQTVDADGDGYGGNASGNNPDRCASESGFSTIRLASDGTRTDFFGCPDNDVDGVADMHDNCPTAAGGSYTDRFACPDSDEDSISDQNDPYPYSPSSGATNGDWDDDGVLDLRPEYGLQGTDVFPDDVSQISDADGDGYGDNSSGNSPDMFPDDDTQWSDSDGDGFGDVEDGTDGDGCIFEAGNSTEPVHGCPDQDGDGRADDEDVFPNDPRQMDDRDGDGYGDTVGNNRTDDCPDQWGDSTLGERGCPDSDGDGWSDYEDECPNQAGHSGPPYTGCLDRDGDGIADQVDDFPDDINETRDSDGDGIGDVGDSFPYDFDNDGLTTELDWDDDDPEEQYDRDDDGVGDNSDKWPDDPERWSDADGDGYTDQAGLEESDNCPSIPGTSTLFQIGCSDIDGDGMPDVLDPDIDGDGVTNDNELDASREGVYFDPFNAMSTPPDMDGDYIPDILDFDRDGDGFPNSFEEERGSSASDMNSTPFSQYGDTNTGMFYIPGEGFQSEYSPEGTEISVSMLIDLITSEYLAVVVMAPLTVFALLAKRRRYKKVRRKLNDAFSLEELEEYEPDIDRLILKGKVRVEHGVLLRNLFERRREEFEENESQTETVSLKGGAETGSSGRESSGSSRQRGGVQRAGDSRSSVEGSSRPSVGDRSRGVTGSRDRDRGASRRRDDDFDDDDYDDRPQSGLGGGRGPRTGREPSSGSRGRRGGGSSGGGSGGGVVRREGGGVRRRRRNLPGDGRY